MNPAVLLVGDLGLDLVLRVPTLPRGDEKLNGERVSQAAGGMSANVAVALARLGTAARLVAAVGDDAHATTVCASLEAEGVEVRLCSRRNTPTFLCVILVGPDGEKALVRVPSAAYLPSPEELAPSMFDDITHLHLTLGSLELTKRAIELAHIKNITISLDLEAADLPADSRDTADMLQALDLLFLNEPTRAALTHHLRTPDISGPEGVITTLGRKGSRGEVRGQVFEQTGYTAKVRDTTGAGDAFAAAFLHFYLRDGDVAGALRFASAAAALSTRSYGAQAGLPQEEDVKAFLHQVEQDRHHA